MDWSSNMVPNTVCFITLLNDQPSVSPGPIIVSFTDTDVGISVEQ